jgi:hypothetical protein
MEGIKFTDLGPWWERAEVRGTGSGKGTECVVTSARNATCEATEI